MKAISIHQPAADLIISGKKTEDLRSWKISYRGPLAIHSTQKIDQIACDQHGIKPENLSTGVVLGYVNLDEIVKLEDQLEITQKKYLSDNGERKKTTYMWKFSNPIKLKNLIPATGRKGIFHVPDEFFYGQTESAEESNSPPVPVSLDSRAPFELRLIQENNNNAKNGTYRLALWQVSRNQPVILNQGYKEQQMSTPQASTQRVVSELGGIPLKIVADAILETLRSNGYSATELNPHRREPFQLSEESGVCLALIFLTIQSLKKTVRMEEIARGIRAMTAEELYYWFAKCTSSMNAERSLKALRLLLSDE